MPFKTPYGSHYHTTYGCHGATEACGTEGLSPCSDCCGKAGAGASARGEMVPGIAGVPQEAITGEMIAFEYGQDYDTSPEQYDNAARFIAMMSSADDRARAARAFAMGVAERGFEQEVMYGVDLIEGEVALPDDVEAIEAMTASRADEAVRTAYRQAIAEGLVPDPTAPRDVPQPGFDRQSLAESIADRLEESGCVPWLSRSLRESLSYNMGPGGLRDAFDDACSLLEARRGVLPEHLPVATTLSDIGEDGMANGQDAPDGKLEIVQGEGQRFPWITAVGRKLNPTHYGDGFDVGDIVTYGVGWNMTLPHFAFVMRRTPKMIETIDLPTVSTPSDGYGQVGTKRPVGVIDLSKTYPTKKSRMRKSGSFSIDGHWTHPWDGDDQDFDYMD